MHITRWSTRALMLLAGLAITTPAQAGWQSPFELTCFRHKQPQTAYYIAPAPSPCCGQVATPAPVVANFVAPPTTCCQPQPVVTTQFVQRTFYQQVTNFQPQTVVEPRTEMRTSFFYEPVTSYRISYAFDPCGCGFTPVATPQTTMQLRSQTVPVTVNVQRTQMVPVTQFRQMTYFEPQTTITPAPTTIIGPLTTTLPAGAVVAPQSAPSNFQPPPGVQENRSPNAGINETRSPSAGTESSPLYRSNSAPQGNGTGRNPASSAYPPVTPRPDRITSNNEGWKPVQATLAKVAIPR
ncbi:MAG TPA: hypothetical protein PLN21_17135 [Gemmatales bacterium]|nr:hypothetical protein [Gemmatales bacterium]